MNVNFAILAVSAIIPLIMGFIWYHPKVFGTVWMVEAGLDEEKLKGANMIKIFAFTYVLSLMAAMVIQFMVIHQYSVYSILAEEPGINDPNSEIGIYLNDFIEKFGNNYRTFKHGAFHGVLTGLFLALPLIGINGMFERRSFKYIIINTGFWIVSFAIMGGIICAFA